MTVFGTHRAGQPRGDPARPPPGIRLRSCRRCGPIKNRTESPRSSWSSRFHPARPRACNRPRAGRPDRRLAAKRILIETKSVELAAFLKWAQAVGTGGQAKTLIQSGRVKVNGQVELRRGLALVPGDRVG